MAVNRPLKKEFNDMFVKYQGLLDKGKKKKAKKVLPLIMSKIQERYVILKLPVHGGYSLFLLETREPRVHLQFIPHPDSIAPPPAHFRGLNLKDIDEMVDQEMVYKPGEW